MASADSCRYLSEAAAEARARARRSPGAAREGSWRLADLDLVAGGRRGAQARCRTACARFRARSASGDHRREPPAVVLHDDGGPGPRRCPGPDVSGRGRGRDGLRVPQRRNRLRDRRGPGAGRQAARDPPRASGARAHLLRRSARPAALHAGRPDALRAVVEAAARNCWRSSPTWSTRRSRWARPTTRRHCSTPRARPASPRASCRRTRR